MCNVLEVRVCLYRTAARKMYNFKFAVHSVPFRKCRQSLVIYRHLYDILFVSYCFVKNKFIGISDRLPAICVLHLNIFPLCSGNKLWIDSFYH